MDDGILDVGAFDGSWAAADDSVAEGLDVIDNGFFGEAATSDGHVEVAISVNTISDLTAFDFFDSFADVRGDGTGLWVWH